MWGHWGEYGYGWGMGFGMLLFWGVLIAAIVLLAKGSWGSGVGEKRDREKSALDILKERYARGEIEREEFEQKKRDLESRGSHGLNADQAGAVPCSRQRSGVHHHIGLSGGS